MPERDRPSLTGLAIKKPLVDRGKPVVPLGEAEKGLLGAEPVLEPVQPDVQLAELREVPLPVQPTVQSVVLSPTLLKARKKEIRIAWTFKIPLELHKELSAVADYNEITMSDIVIEAIQFHLPNFPHPPKR